MQQHKDVPKIRWVPPIYFGLWIAVGALLGVLAPLTMPEVVAQAWGWTFLMAAMLLNLWTVSNFRRASTPLNVRRPAQSFISHGPFRFSRNPLYLSMAMSTVGFGCIAGLYWVVLLLPVFVVAFNRLVIVPEESYLAEKFGDQYLAYAGAVRRWL